MIDSEFRPTDEALTFLLSPEGSALLTQLAAMQIGEANLLYHTTRLRKTLPSDVVAAALDLARLRQRARAKFTRADEMFFTRLALQQASAEVVSRHRAQRFARYSRVADLCCGIGGDALALAAHAAVLAVDVDPLRLRMASANAHVYGVGVRLDVECADVTAYSVPAGEPFWADPSRRANGRRVFSLADYRPPLPALLRLAAKADGVGIKLSPGVDYDELEGMLGATQHEVEIISVHGQGREAVLWLGDLCTAARRRATLLPGGHSLTGCRFPGSIAVRPVGRYLYEPDAAVIRAHLVEQVAEVMGASKIDEWIAYLTTDKLVETPFATAYRVAEVMPFGLKRINRRLRTLDVGELIVKKRGFPVDPEQFRRRLKYGGGQRRVVLVLTRVQDQPTALICYPVRDVTRGKP